MKEITDCKTTEFNLYDAINCKEQTVIGAIKELFERRQK